jgi:hypothetical protein
MWSAEPDLVAWMERSRLDVARGINAHLAEPQTQAAVARYVANSEPALDNLDSLLSTLPKNR